ncbi:MAG: hypothetical protein EBY22_00385 [Gammaproteobacteria bacterium]|nr:hypothetical protein [Gammaproteobacteria bacterium]
MHKIFLSLILLFSNSLPVLALSADTLPLSFQIKEQKCQGGCFHLAAQEERMGLLLPAPKKSGTYEFFDAQGQLQVTWGLVLSHAFSPEEELAMLQFMLSRIN